MRAHSPRVADSGTSGVYAGGKWFASGSTSRTFNPATNEPLGTVVEATVQDYKVCEQELSKAQEKWQALPMPVRGEIVRQIGDALRAKKQGSLLFVSSFSVLVYVAISCLGEFRLPLVCGRRRATT
jgi:delta 1-pyrroline-5-carboxylate dehydrogenase